MCLSTPPSWPVPPYIGFSMCNMMSSENITVLLPPNLMPFISFSCLIAVARTSNNMLNKSGESGHHCLLPDLSGKAH